VFAPDYAPAEIAEIAQRLHTGRRLQLPICSADAGTAAIIGGIRALNQQGGLETGVTVPAKCRV
jgi:hypothetical protein